LLPTEPIGDSQARCARGRRLDETSPVCVPDYQIDLLASRAGISSQASEIDTRENPFCPPSGTMGTISRTIFVAKTQAENNSVYYVIVKEPWRSDRWTT
jgi:hypothetical protein